MATELYVGNLSYTTHDQDLNAMFAGTGAVIRARIVTDHKTLRSRGFGFVTMATKDGAERAISSINGREVEGRTLVVTESRPREDGRSAQGHGGNDSQGTGGSRSSLYHARHSNSLH